MLSATPSVSPMRRAIADRAWRWLPSATPGATQLDLSQDLIETTPPPHVRQAAKDALDRGETHYTDRPGVPELRDAVARLLREAQGLPIAGKNNVVITCGGREARYIAIQNLVRPGDRVLVPPLRSPGVDEVIRIAEGQVVEAPATPADPAFAAALTDDIRLVMLPSPANPTGETLDLTAVTRLADALSRVSTVVVWDQSLMEPPTAGAGEAHLAAHPMLAERTITLGSLSHAWGLGPWRVGYLAGPDALLKPMRDLKQALTICTTAVSQFAALAALTGPQDWLRDLAAERQARRAAATDALRTLGTRVADGVGPYVWANASPLGLDGDQLAGRLAQRGVRVTPGSTYGPAGRPFVRITLAAPAETLATALGASL